MRLKQLESALSGVQTFPEPKIELEQYPTSPHLAARMLHVAASFGDVEDRLVADLGCGSGILGIAAGILGAGYVVGVDVDEEILPVASQNAEESEVEIDFVHANIADLAPEGAGLLSGSRPAPFDTVVMNPPFGTRVKGADMQFLRVALSLCDGAVYSLHKSSTREHIEKKAREQGVKSTIVAEMRFDVPKMYKFHTEKSRDIAVDFWRFAHV